MHKMVVHCRQEPYDVYIGRGTEWGNPFHIGKDGDRDEVCDKYIKLRGADPEFVAKVKKELAGKVLGCSCSPWRCHGEWLAEIAGGGPPEPMPSLMPKKISGHVFQRSEEPPHKQQVPGSSPGVPTMADPSGVPSRQPQGGGLAERK